MSNNKQTPAEKAAASAAIAAADEAIGIKRSTEAGFKIGGEGYTLGEVRDGKFAAGVIKARAAAAGNANSK